MFYHLRPDSYSFIFPQAGPGNDFSNGPITSVTPFFSVPIADAGNSALFFAIGLGGTLLMSSQRAVGTSFSKALGAIQLTANTPA